MNLMEKHQHKLRLATIVLLCVLNIGFGLYAGQMPMLISGAVGMVYAATAAKGLYHPTKPVHRPLPATVPAETLVPAKGPAEASLRGGVPAEHQAARVPAVAVNPPAAPRDPDALVRHMLGQSRHALLLRKQVVGNLNEHQFREACQQLHARMALVPEGEVVLCRGDEDELVGPPSALASRRVQVAALFLDRYAMTNRQYYEFVAAGGYREMTLWDPQVWPAVLDLLDRTGQPGPAFWQHGRYLPGEEDLPVVGVSWYEAQACARWMGKRLPADAEWVKAACWPVATDGAAMIQRRFPWGDGFDRSRANLWGSGPNRIVVVTGFPDGASVGGIYQMIGNVWEWNANDFRFSGGQSESGAAPLKSIRGGAFDTYFDNQATCQFESGEYPLSRRPNIGFRCAISACELVLALPPARPEEQADAEVPPREEVNV
jgi:iron(II)-dependent oxidoreductase